MILVWFGKSITTASFSHISLNVAEQVLEHTNIGKKMQEDEYEAKDLSHQNPAKYFAFMP